MSALRNRIRRLEGEGGDTCPCGATGTREAWNMILHCQDDDHADPGVSTEPVCPQCRGPLPKIPLEYLREELSKLDKAARRGS